MHILRLPPETTNQKLWVGALPGFPHYLEFVGLHLLSPGGLPQLIPDQAVWQGIQSGSPPALASPLSACMGVRPVSAGDSSIQDSEPALFCFWSRTGDGTGLCTGIRERAVRPVSETSALVPAHASGTDPWEDPQPGGICLEEADGEGRSAPAWASWAEGPCQMQLAGGACIHGKGPIPHLRRCVPLKAQCQAGFLPGGGRVGVLDPECGRRGQPAVHRAGHQVAAPPPRGPAVATFWRWR